MIRLLIASLLGLSLAACSQPEQPAEEMQAAEELKSAAATPVDEGAAWLAENAKKDGVTVTASGLQYEVIKSGSGATPGPTDKVLTHYHGTFIDGRVFDSSVERGEPIEFPVNRVIKGWTEALQLMKEGDKWRLFIPSDLAYGERGAGSSIPPNTPLVFEVELIKVTPAS